MYGRFYGTGFAKALAVLIGALLIGAVGTSCGDDDGGSTNGAKSGQTVLSFTLKGGDLDEPLNFQGTVDRKPELLATSSHVTITDADLMASNGNVRLASVVFTTEHGETTILGAKDVDFTARFDFPDEGKTIALLSSNGEGSFMLERHRDKEMTVRIEFQVSPSHGDTELVFQLEGLIESYD